MALTLRQLSVRLLALGGGGILLGALACAYAIGGMFSGGRPLSDEIFPVSLLTLAISALALLTGLILGIVALARR